VNRTARQGHCRNPVNAGDKAPPAIDGAGRPVSAVYGWMSIGPVTPHRTLGAGRPGQNEVGHLV